MLLDDPHRVGVEADSEAETVRRFEAALTAWEELDDRTLAGSVADDVAEKKDTEAAEFEAIVPALLKVDPERDHRPDSKDAKAKKKAVDS